MATHAPDSEGGGFWSRRMVEWSILSLVLVALFWIFGLQVREVQAQGEKVGVWSTLAQLRAALVVEQLRHRMRPGEATAEKNPFRLLQALPPNFAGEIAVQDAEKALPGNWFYDPACGCAGYRLLYPQWLEPVQAADTVWFKIVITTGEVLLVPRGRYVWFGQAL